MNGWLRSLFEVGIILIEIRSSRTDSYQVRREHGSQKYGFDYCVLSLLAFQELYNVLVIWMRVSTNACSSAHLAQPWGWDGWYACNMCSASCGADFYGQDCRVGCMCGSVVEQVRKHEKNPEGPWNMTVSRLPTCWHADSAWYAFFALWEKFFGVESNHPQLWLCFYHTLKLWWMPTSTSGVFQRPWSRSCSSFALSWPDVTRYIHACGDLFDSFFQHQRWHVSLASKLDGTSWTSIVKKNSDFWFIATWPITRTFGLSGNWHPLVTSNFCPVSHSGYGFLCSAWRQGSLNVTVRGTLGIQQEIPKSPSVMARSRMCS